MNINLWTPQHSKIAHALSPILVGDQWLDRWDIAWYVNRCEIAGWCNTDDLRRQAAQRYIAGKRKVTPPGTRRRKVAAKQRARLISNLPTELRNAIDMAVVTDIAKQYAQGNDKALNALVGMVLKAHKADPAAVRELLQKQLRPGM